MADASDARSRPAYVASCVATIAFAAVFVLPMYRPQAVPWYYPLEWRWAWEVAPTALAMDFFGRGVLALVVALPLAAIAYTVGRRVRAIPDRALDLLSAWAITATVFAMIHFGWHLYFRDPMPAPLPEWYVPR